MNPIFDTPALRNRRGGPQRSGKPEPHPAIRRGWIRVLLFLPAWAVAELSVALTAVVIVAACGAVAGVSEGQLAALGQSLLYFDASVPTTFFAVELVGFSGTLLAVVLFRRLVDGKTVFSLGFRLRGYGLHFGAGCFVGAVAITLGYAVLLGAGLLSFDGWNPFSGSELVLMLAVFAVVAVNEEIVLRGYVLSNLRASMNGYLAVFVSAAVFASLHMWNAHLSFLGMLNLALAGVILGLYYHHFQNLWFPVGLHLTWNFTQGPVFGFNVSGTDTGGLLRHSLDGPAWLTGGGFGLEGSVFVTALEVVMVIGIQIWAMTRLRAGASAPRRGSG